MAIVTRIDETWQRLLGWTHGQAPSERLSAQILAHENYQDIDPSHPLGGKDGGRDAMCVKDGKSYVMAVYFPRGQQSFATIESKFAEDLDKAEKHGPAGFVFATNQELRLGERKTLRGLGEEKEIIVDLFHLERITGVLDRPPMSQVRKQYLDIDPGPMPIDVELEIIGAARHLSDTDEILEWWLAYAEGEARKNLTRRREDRVSLLTLSPPMPWIKASKEPSTEDELDERLIIWEKEVRGGWTESLHHLAATAWEGLRFQVRNTGGAFLNDVQIIVTIHEAQGIAWRLPDRFDEDRLFPPVVPDPVDMWASTPELLDDFRNTSYPVSWRNVGDAVEVTLDLKHLRPHPVWESDDDDVVLLVEGKDLPAELSAKWTVTAQGYGTVYEGTQIAVPVESKSVLDAMKIVSNSEG